MRSRSGSIGVGPSRGVAGAGRRDGGGVDEGVVEDGRAPACSKMCSMCWEAVRPRDSLAWVIRLQM